MLRKHTGLMVCLILLCCAVPCAWASGGSGSGDSGSHEEGSISLFSGDLGNAVWTLLIFGLVLLVLSKFAWKPILDGLQKREVFIRDSLSDAKREREEAEKVLADYTEKVQRAGEEATAIVDEGRRDAEEVRKKMHAEAKVEADAIIARAKKEIELARDDAVKQLHDQTILLATDVAGRMIRKELKPGDHKDLLDQALRDMGELN